MKLDYDLEDSFDNEEAEAVLSLSFDKITHVSDIVRKSMYDFDLDTPDGINKLMALLPIMDPDILKDIMTEILEKAEREPEKKRSRTPRNPVVTCSGPPGCLFRTSGSSATSETSARKTVTPACARGSARSNA
jgi:hypothetical protein